jgi:signal transduction histidine kinase/ActR/RegA family two-component response regulator
MRRVSLKVLIAAAISLVSLLLTAAVSYVIARDAVNRLEMQIGRALALLADEMQDKLDRAMFERLQSLDDMTEIARIPANTETPDSLRASLERFQAAYADYSWVGYAKRDGTIESATGGVHEGDNVKNEAWFKEGLEEPYVGDVKIHRREGDPQDKQKVSDFIDLSVPVSNDEETLGVLGATLSADWAEEVKDTLLGSMKSSIPADVIVLNEARQVLFGPDDIAGKTLDLPSIRGARAGIAGFAIEQWPGGRPYVTGFSKSDGYRSYPGLHWIVLVREDQKLAFEPVRSLQRNILIWGALFSALAALLSWALASQLSRPLLQLADAAEGLRRGRQVNFPAVDGYDEARVLALSLRSMLAELTAQRASLAAANQTLESQVRERTQRLAEQNVGLERAKAEAEQATEAKSRFLAAASHDLRQPLHALTLFARALSRRVQAGEATTLVAQMEEGLHGLKGMFDALLNVSRLDAKLIEPTKVPTSIAEIIERVSVGSKVEAEQNGLRFLSHSKDWTLETDPALLETMIRNLVSNALKFTKRGGVVLAARRRNGQRMIDVYDSGPGLSPEQHEMIFEEFARTDRRAGGANDGLGLGLSIARRYADLLGMQIIVCSRQQRGSRFSIVLPPERIIEAMPEKSNMAKDEIDVHGFRILVLDDDALIVSALSRDLRDRGNAVFGYQHAPDAAAALSEGLAIDAAILDFDLRDQETGLEFITRMSAELECFIPAVILSGGTDSATLATLAKSGRPWLTKPADPELIVATLNAVIKAGRVRTSEVEERASID